MNYSVFLKCLGTGTGRERAILCRVYWDLILKKEKWLALADSG